VAGEEAEEGEDEGGKGAEDGEEGCEPHRDGGGGVVSWSCIIVYDV
jgi:hypothetical protein